MESLTLRFEVWVDTYSTKMLLALQHTVIPIIRIILIIVIIGKRARGIRKIFASGVSQRRFP